ncbi:centromere protein C isoform X2 [Lathamus discolor]|uniref:centromere protein C isoform X2 n=1 Tax=Lathamus discolor TaxID=678569 RepID=UPI0032B81445
MSSSSSRQPRTANDWDCHKREYRARFCRGRGNKIAVEPGQNVLELIQDGFESCGNDLTITSSSPAHCSTPIIRNDNMTTRSTGELTNSVERAFNSAVSLPASPLKPVNNRGCSHTSPLKPVICDYVADSKTPESPVSKIKTNDTLKDVEALRKSPDVSLDPEDDHGPIRLLLLEEAKGPPVHTLHVHGQNAPAAVKSHMEVKNLGGPQTGRDEQVVLMNGTERIATSSIQKRKSFSSVVLAAVATETPGKRYSASISPPSPPPMKDQDIENECDFFIDESYDVSVNSFFSIPRTNKKSRKASSATPVSKFQPSEKMTEGKKSKNGKTQVEALTKQKMDDLDFSIHQLKGTSESDSISDSEEKVLKSRRQNVTRMEREKTEGKKGKKIKVQGEACTKQKMDDLDVRTHELKGTSESDSISDSEEKVLKSRRQNVTRMEREKTEGKKGKKIKVQGEACTKQKMDDLDVRTHELKGTSESDSISDSEEKVLKSRRQNVTRMEREKTEGKKGKKIKVQGEACTKQKMDDLDVRTHELKGTSESDSVSDSEGKVLKSRRQNVTRMEREKTEGKKGKKIKVQGEACNKQKMDDLDVRMRESEGTSESDSISDSEGKFLKSQKQNVTRMEKEKTKGKKGKKRKVQVEARTKQKMDDLDVRTHELEGTSESDSISDSEGKVLKSRRQNVTHMGKTKKDALKQSSPNKKKDTSWKPEAKKITLSQSGLETKACDAERCKTMVMPSEDSLMSSAGHQQKRSLSPKEKLKFSGVLRSASKASQHLVHKKQSVKQKHPGATVTKRLAGSSRKKLKKTGKKSSERKPQLQRKEISHSVPSEEELESEPVKLDEVFASVLHQELETSVIQNSAQSKKPKNVLQTLESIGGANYETPVKALQHVVGSVKNSGKKLLSAKSSGKIPKRSHCRNSEGVCLGPEDNESEMDSDSSSVQESTRENHKLSDVKIKRNKRKRYAQRGLNRPVLEHCDKFTSGSQYCEQDNTSSDNSEGLDSKIQHLLSDELARHKIVMPSNTPNVRRTKRLRLRPLEYWRGERVNYTMRPSGGLVISGIVCPEPEPPRKITQRKDGHKQRRDEKRSEIPANMDHSLADTSKPTAVVDPETNEEVLLKCVNTEGSNSCFFKDESVEIYKNLDTSTFAIGKLILKPFKEKGYQFVHMDTIAFHIICGKLLVTLHKTSYYLTTGDFFCVPAGNGYNIRNLLNKESVLLFTQLKKDRPNPHSMLET